MVTSSSSKGLAKEAAPGVSTFVEAARASEVLIASVEKKEEV